MIEPLQNADPHRRDGFRRAGAASGRHPSQRPVPIPHFPPLTDGYHRPTGR